MAKGPWRDREEKKVELMERIDYHKKQIEKIEKQLEDLDKPRKPGGRPSKKQELLKEKINNGSISLEEAAILGYKEKEM